MKHWNTTVIQDGKPITLYVTTTDQAIELDAEASKKGGSLIDYARHGRPAFITNDDHKDLAMGTLCFYAQRKGMSAPNQIIETQQIPAGLSGTWLGGVSTHPSFQSAAVVVYEDAEAWTTEGDPCSTA
jgi:hypothetical protein